jgi:hypothetical protein
MPLVPYTLNNLDSEISGCHYDEYEDNSLLRYCAV